MGARFYDPVLNRFLSADTIVPDILQTQAANRYSYNYNNPLSYTDPSGHQPQPTGISWGGYSSVPGADQSFDFEMSTLGGGSLSSHPLASSILPSTVSSYPGMARRASDLGESSRQTTNRSQDIFHNGDSSGGSSELPDLHYVGEFALQYALQIGDFLGTAVEIVVELGPVGCKCGIPNAQHTWDEFKERQSGRKQALQDVRAQAEGESVAAESAPLTQIEINSANGEAFQARVSTYGTDTLDNFAEEVSIRPNTASGPAPFRIRIDGLGTNPESQAIELLEAKGSETARLTIRQTEGFPLIKQYGGAIVGGKGGVTFPAGTPIPPGTTPQIIRPNNLPLGY
jgi:hypothetical protein